MKDIENRFVNIELALARAERTIEELNGVIIEQGKTIDRLKMQNRYLLNACAENDIRPLSEETPPPHY